MVEPEAIERKLKELGITPHPIPEGTGWRVSFPEIHVVSRDRRVLNHLQGTGSSPLNALVDAFNQSSLEGATIYVEGNAEDPKTSAPFEISEADVLTSVIFY
jgi:hypothetical protein